MDSHGGIAGMGPPDSHPSHPGDNDPALLVRGKQAPAQESGYAGSSPRSAAY